MSHRSHGLVRPLLVGLCAAWAQSVALADDSPFTARYYECQRTTAPPKIDGRLDDACWNQASAMAHFVDCLGQAGRPARFQTVARIVYDTHNLYVGVRCLEPQMHKLVAKARDSYAGLFSDDCVEVFVDTNHDRKTYYHFATNVNGARYEGAGFNESWSCNWHAAGWRGSDAWTVELAIPLAVLGGEPKAGVWGLNVNREHQAGGQREYSGWSLVRGGFHKPAEFGHVVFGGLFPKLGRGDLPMIGRYAAMTLSAETDLVRLKRQTHSLLRSNPSCAPWRVKVRPLDGQVAALKRRYGSRKHLGLTEWVGLHDTLGRLAGRYRAIHWDLKFEALLADY